MNFLQNLWMKIIKKKKVKKKYKRYSIAYLAGPMEYAENAGRKWRDSIENVLRFILNIRCVYPEREENLITNQEELNQLKENNIQQYIDIMRQLINMDLQFVEKVDMLIVYWQGERMSGTIGECQHAYLHDIPVYLVTDIPQTEIPGWFLACTTQVFTNFQSLYTYLIDYYQE